tara:strand:- start:301 stop:1068 length:768 start_codon:yes stop_codon:yes gene_type:complete
VPFSKELNNVIKKFLNTCNIPAEASTYLETGLLDGNSVQFALDLNFKKIISLEINKSFIDNANQRFKNEVKNSRVLLVQGDSQEKIKEIYDESINILFLDAHDNLDKEVEVDEAIIAPLENEIKFLLNKIAEKQLIIIDDFIKIKHSYLFSNRKGSWKSKLSYKKFKEIISDKGLNTFEVYSSIKGVCYLALTKNKNFKMGIIFNLKNLVLKFYITLWFYYSKNVFWVMFKRFIIFLLPHKFYIFSKKYYNKLKK